MIWNISHCIKNNLTDKLIDRQIEVKNPKFVDQCILNSVCEGQVKYLSYDWNYTWHIDFFDSNFKSFIPEEEKSKYLAAKKILIFFHFTAINMKPWIDPSLDGSYNFWKYARMTPFYESILYKNLKTSYVRNHNNHQSKSIFRYYLYLVLTKITFGEIKQHYILKTKKHLDDSKK